MKIETAYEISEGRKIFEEVDANLGEMIMLSMGACLTDDGDIWCLQCNSPNECCKCE